MKYGRRYPHPTEVKSHRDRATFRGNTDRNWLSNDLNSGHLIQGQCSFLYTKCFL